MCLQVHKHTEQVQDGKILELNSIEEETFKTGEGRLEKILRGQSPILSTQMMEAI